MKLPFQILKTLNSHKINVAIWILDKDVDLSFYTRYLPLLSRAFFISIFPMIPCTQQTLNKLG